MLEAIREQVHTRWPGSQLMVPDSMPVEVRAELDLLPVLLRDGHPLDPRRWRQWLPRRVRGLAAVRSADVILDASGFGYGDYWGRNKLVRRLVRTLRSKATDCPAILLPQALGPFEKPGMAAAFAEAVDRLDLVFVRDAQSMKHVNAIISDDPKVHRAPDFTNMLHPKLPDRLSDLRGARLVIPNQKMIADQSASNEERYLRFLITAVERLRQSDKQVVILLHEGLKDRAIVDNLNARLDEPCPVVDEPSPLVTKAVIAAAEMIVSSRFHGLVSALSSGVPALACGWSHKYRELLADYGAADYLVDVNHEENWMPKLDALVSGASDPAFRDRLTVMAKRERLKSEKMWDDVTDLVCSRAS